MHFIIVSVQYARWHCIAIEFLILKLYVIYVYVWRGFPACFLQLLTAPVLAYRYVPAYSTRLKFQSGTWIVLPSNSTDPMGTLDPIWTESNWNAIGLRVYTVQTATYDRLVLLGGIALTGCAYVAVIITKACVAKILKQDWKWDSKKCFWTTFLVDCVWIVFGIHLLGCVIIEAASKCILNFIGNENV